MTLEERVTKLEANEREQYALDKSQDEQIKTLFETVKVMRNVMYTFCFFMLLALIYGALGPRGFNAVRSIPNPVTSVIAPPPDNRFYLT